MVLKLKNLLNYIKKPWFIDTYSKLAHSFSKYYHYLSFKYREEFEQNREIYESRKRRVYDAVFMRRIPDRVPVGGGGINFFAAKYSGISIKDYMYDYKKMKAATIKMNSAFDLDVTFPTFMFAMARFMTATQANLIKIPGRELQDNASYQYNEFERLKQEEYPILLKQGMDFFMAEIAPRISNVLNMKFSKRFAYYTRVLLETLKYTQVIMDLTVEFKAKGFFSPISSFSFPPMDLMSFVLEQ